MGEDFREEIEGDDSQERERERKCSQERERECSQERENVVHSAVTSGRSSSSKP